MLDVLVTQRRWTAWTPTGAKDCAAVLAELDSVLSHAQFSHSKRYPALLRYLVEHTLAGDVSQIKERTLGIEVFGRPATYDTTNDTVVRFTAGEVRRRLVTFYLQHDDRPIQIVLPIGSYVPEFLRADEEEAAPLPPMIRTPLHSASQEHASTAIAVPVSAIRLPESKVPASALTATAEPRRSPHRRLPLALVLSVCGMVFLASFCALLVRGHLTHSTALDRFWKPLAQDSRPPLIVAGGNIFSTNGYSGTETASRAVDYPFVSMQIASAMARISGILQHEGSSVEIAPANATMLSELRNRPIILIGGYNNDWTGRLTSRLPLHLADAANPAIQDSTPGGGQWQRDRTQPYSASDDFALIGQYREQTTGGMIVIVAGIGRNGSEAASQFLTEERSLELLEQRLGRKLDGLNFEAVLRVPVVQGRTGAPTLLTTRTW